MNQDAVRLIIDRLQSDAFNAIDHEMDRSADEATEHFSAEFAKRDATIDRLVSALKTIGMHQYFIDAILAGPGAAPATEEEKS